MKKFWKVNKSIIKFIVILFCVWQGLLILLSVLSPEIITGRERFTYNDGEKIINPVFFWNRANFDGSHYLGISRNGYGFGQQAFFPFYPSLIKEISPVFGNMDLLGALLISNLSFLISLFVLYKLIRLDFKESVAKNTLLFLILFPFSFFFGMAYTEGLFFLLVLLSFFSARKQWWLAAGIFGALAANTRIVGVLVFPALLYEWWIITKVQSASWRTKFTSKFSGIYGVNKVKSLLPILLVPMGLLAYMRFLFLKYGDALMFVHVQPDFGAGRSGDKIILLYQVFWRYFKMILTTRLDILYFSVWAELIVSVLFIFLLFMAIKKHIRPSYIIFSVFAFVVPTLSGSFLSMPRFVLILFPGFLVLGGIDNRRLRNILLSIFAILFAVSTLLFYQGYWVA